MSYDNLGMYNLLISRINYDMALLQHLFEVGQWHYWNVTFKVGPIDTYGQSVSV